MYLIANASQGDTIVEKKEILQANYDMRMCIAPEWDKPKVFEFLPGCAGTDCQCGGKIHPKSQEILLP